MAYIQFSESDEIEYLREYHTFGRRTEAVDTHLAYSFISKLHAVIEWKDPHWMLRDVSSNGIWVNGERVEAQVRSVLKLNDLLELAGADGVRFKVVDLTPPRDMLIRTDSKLLTLPLNHEGVLVPSEESPLIALHKCPDRLQWFSEKINPSLSVEPKSSSDDSGVEALNVREDTSPYEFGPYQHGDNLEVDDEVWQFYLLSENDATTELQSQNKEVDDVEFRFDISQDEETTELTLLHEHQEFDLGERSHHYLIAHLLRHKAALFKKEENSTASKPTVKPSMSHLGWIDCQLLASELGIDESHLNILIYRARKQVSSELLDFVGRSRFIERRRGQVRVGIDNFSIHKEGVREV